MQNRLREITKILCSLLFFFLFVSPFFWHLVFLHYFQCVGTKIKQPLFIYLFWRCVFSWKPPRDWWKRKEILSELIFCSSKRCYLHEHMEISMCFLFYFQQFVYCGFQNIDEMIPKISVGTKFSSGNRRISKSSSSDRLFCDETFTMLPLISIQIH